MIQPGSAPSAAPRQPRPQLDLVLVALGVCFSLTLSGFQCGPKQPLGIAITSPAHGAFSTLGNSTISGQVQGARPDRVRVTVKHQNLSPQLVPVQPDGTWSVQLPLDADAVVNAFLAEVMETRTGEIRRDRTVVLAGESVADGAFSPSSLALRLNDAGLDQIEPLASSLVGFDISGLVPAGSVLLDDCMVDGGALGCLGTARVVVANPPPSISDFSIDADSRAGFLAGATTVEGLRIDLDLIGTGLVPSCGLRLTASAFDLTGAYDLQPGEGVPLDVNLIGSVGASFAGFDQEFTYGICSAPVIGDIIQLIVGDLEPRLVEGLQRFLADPDGSGPFDSPIAQAVEDGLASVDLAGSVGELIGVSLEAPGVLASEDEHGFTLGADSRALAQRGSGPGRCQPSADTPDLLGSLEISTHFPTFGATTPEGGLPYGIGIGLSPSALNQIFKGALECGLLDLELTELKIIPSAPAQPITAGLLASFDPAFAGFPPGMPLEIQIRPTLAPIVTRDPGPRGELLELRIGQLRFELVDAATGALYLGAFIDIRFGVDLDLDAEGIVPIISQPAPEDVLVAVVDNPLHANALFLELALPFILPPVFPAFGEVLGSVPLPGFLGLLLVPVEITRHADFVSIFADLAIDPNAPRCAESEQYYRGLCYPRCQGGYTPIGSACWQVCAAGFNDQGATCSHDLESIAKASYGRGVGSPAGCSSSEELDAGLCYPLCGSGYTGVGPVCWQDCAPGFQDDGAFCRKDAEIIAKASYGRGAGSPMTCAANEQYDAGLCYPYCQSGYTGVGPVCWQICPAGYTDDGAFCRRDAHIFAKDSSGCPWYNLCCAGCPAGYTDDGCFCRRDAHIFAKGSYGRGAGGPVHACPAGQQLDAGLCYSYCQSGYTGVGPVCWQNCPGGFIDDGAFCRKDAIILAKNSYGRGVGAPVHACTAGQDFDAGLCYVNCQGGYSGAGPVCWQDCAPGYIDDGAFCRVEAFSFSKDFYDRTGRPLY